MELLGVMMSARENFAQANSFSVVYPPQVLVMCKIHYPRHPAEREIFVVFQHSPVNINSYW